ncbi:MAG: hypothetical protein AB8B85_04955 [Paracoccaceae bacterium]
MRQFVTSLGLLIALTVVALMLVPRAWIAAPISNEPRWMMNSGFVNDHPDVGPWTWLWSSRMSLRIDHPEDTNIVIWNHHTEAMAAAPSCLGRAYFPPPSIMALEALGRTRVYYLCTRSSQERGKPFFAEQRRDEILALVNGLRDLGVPAGRIFLAGQSGGSCSSLFALGAAPKSMNAGILFAPACHGQGEGALRQLGRLDKLAQKVEADIVAAEQVRALLIGFDNDAWNRPEDLDFLAQRWPEEVRVFSPHCGANHSGAFYGCGVEKVANAVRAYFLEQLEAGGLPAPKQSSTG